MKELKEIWARQTDSYGEFERIKVYFNYDGIDMDCVMMNFEEKGSEKEDWKIVEMNYAKGHKPTSTAQKQLVDMANNDEIIVYR